jgi:hypothetical protein
LIDRHESCSSLRIKELTGNPLDTVTSKHQQQKQQQPITMNSPNSSNPLPEEGPAAAGAAAAAGASNSSDMIIEESKPSWRYVLAGRKKKRREREILAGPVGWRGAKVHYGGARGMELLANEAVRLLVERRSLPAKI